MDLFYENYPSPVCSNTRCTFKLRLRPGAEPRGLFNTDGGP